MAKRRKATTRKGIVQKGYHLPHLLYSSAEFLGGKLNLVKKQFGDSKANLPWYRNLLQLQFVRSVVKFPIYPYILQFGALIFFLLFIYFGWQQPIFVMDSAAEKLFLKLNFTTFIVWGIWWPSMIWIAFLIGRAWCHVCPLELLMNFAERIGRWLRIPQKLMPKAFRNGILIIIGYLIVQFTISTFHIHRAPYGAAIFLLSLGILAFFFGFFYKYRSFCSFVCPVGILLNCYSRNAPFELRIISEKVCNKCSTKNCKSPATYNQWNKRGCPSLLNPPKLNSNKECLLCMQCVKACPYDNIRFGIRKFFKDIVSDEKMSIAIPLFLIIITGFLTYELTLNNTIKDIFLAAPHWTEHFFSVTNPHWKGFLKGLWVLVIFPSAIWLTFAGIYGLFSQKQKLSFYFKTYAIAFIPLLVSAHLSKTLDKWNSWLKGIKLPFKDPFGVETFRAIFVEKTMLEPGKIIAVSTLRWLPLIFLAIGSTVSLIKIVQTNKHLAASSVKITTVAKAIPLLMLLFISIVFFVNVWMW